MAFSPSTPFIAKNQLASEGPLAIQLVIIPALKPTVDPSLVQDGSLCPVRALRYYLGKTKDLRKGYNSFLWLLRRATQKISQGLLYYLGLSSRSFWHTKSLIRKCKMFPKSRLEVRALAASLAFKGGVALDEIMFLEKPFHLHKFLLEMCWHNGDVMKIGPVVAAQHVVNF